HPRVAGVRQISPQRQEEKKRAQNILTLRNPGDGFDVQGMQREDGSYERTAPKGTRGAPQKQEQQERVGNVEQDIDQMLRPGVLAEELAIQLMGQPSQRMPIAGMGRRKGPSHVLARQSTLHVR